MFTYLFWVYIGLKFKYSIRKADDIPKSNHDNHSKENEFTCEKDQMQDNEYHKLLDTKIEFITKWFKKFVINFGTLYRTEI